MFKVIKQIVYVVIVLNILAIAWGRFFNPIITWTQIEGIILYQKLDRDYISFDEMGDWVKKAPTIKRGVKSAAEVQFLSKQQRIFFFGMEEVG